jgi:acetylornithine deacetylase/succinyl-diaminopimelate desuccinylase-like protein
MRKALAAVLALTTLPVFATDAHETAYADMAVELLTRYLRLNTTNPPGNELTGALFFKQVLEREGITVEIDEFTPGRANLLATLKGSGAKRPIIISNHMDVVPADAARWSVSAFSGASKNGLVYGRGAVDMKGEGIVQLVAFIRLKRESAPLERDVMFLATADEELGFSGARRALEHWKDRLLGAEYFVTEGGENRLGDDGRPLYFGIQTAQKAPYWLTLKTTGRPGHGSRPIPDAALNRMVRALERIRLWRTDLVALPTVAKFFRDQAPQMKPPQSGWYRDVAAAIKEPAAARALYDGDESLSALLRNTVSITIVRAGSATNVIPGTAEAELDVRLLPGQDPVAFLAQIKKVIDDPSVEVVPPPSFIPAAESRIDTELFRSIEASLARRYPGVPVTTKMGTGATESSLYRPLGIVCYGFTPLLLTTAEDASQHSDDERVPEKTLRESVGIFHEVLVDIARRK